MKALSSNVLTIHHPTRQRVYMALLSEPQATWTVRRLAELNPDVSVQGMRTTLHLLLGEHLVDMVKHQRSLALRLTGDGEEILTEILRSWNALDLAAGRKGEQ